MKGLGTHMKTSLLNDTSHMGSRVKRSKLGMYDVFSISQSGDKFMHTGQRTRPPSGGKVNIKLDVDGTTRYNTDYSEFPTLFRNPAGKDVIGFQSVRLTGQCGRGEDGAIIGYADTLVYHLGKATVSV